MPDVAAFVQLSVIGMAQFLLHGVYANSVHQTAYWTLLSGVRWLSDPVAVYWSPFVV